MFLLGPKKVWNEWEKIGDDANSDVISVVTLGLQAHLSQQGMYNPRKGNTTAPQATDVMFIRPTMVMNMPDDVDFKGASNMGPFEGLYHPKTGEVEAKLAIGGGVGIPGSGGKKASGAGIKITGRVKKGVVTAEVDGKPAVLVYPKVEDE
jgi:hypothetical protein